MRFHWLFPRLYLRAEAELWQKLWGYAAIQDERRATTARVAFCGSACLPVTLEDLAPFMPAMQVAAKPS